MRLPSLVSIVGTRPEAIKMAPVALALQRLPGVRHQVFLTGQHSGLADYFDLPEESLRELGFKPRDRDVERLRAALRALLCGHFRRQAIDLVLVHGDTTSAAAGALAARDCGIPVAHVEAGLRSFDLDQPWPEEGHRISIDGLAELLFAPTEHAADNLRREPRVKGRILVTGNSGIDALLQAKARLPSPAASQERRLILATCHRRENQGEPARAVCEAIRRIASELPVRVAATLHFNPMARGSIEEGLSGVEHVQLLEPQGYDAMVGLMESSWLVLTDSGGLQEEAPALGKPVLVLREVTERPEAVATNSLELVGTDPDRIVAAVAGLLADPERYALMARPAFPFGDGRASERIAGAIGAWLGERGSS
ncbi:MAG TPA: UDP-N-acetylglucosamine 2-epimerase (non-hydrolyzing) [Allosphingosinicella sp.]|nr:UDP-N-acetylglucosamine 2-epimerase (non-hydrolyzing) [Allosphingosinicella sp.]